MSWQLWECRCVRCSPTPLPVPRPCVASSCAHPHRKAQSCAMSRLGYGSPGSPSQRIKIRRAMRSSDVVRIRGQREMATMRRKHGVRRRGRRAGAVLEAFDRPGSTRGGFLRPRVPSRVRRSYSHSQPRLRLDDGCGGIRISRRRLRSMRLAIRMTTTQLTTPFQASWHRSSLPLAANGSGANAA
jgi:hypothetical protein